MLTLQWLLTGVALAGTALALLRARQLARRLDRLAESYWELRYEYGQLRARVTRLEPPEPEGADTAQPASSAMPSRSTTSFVPLSSLKR